ncbi:hypothetical protein ABEB36_014966 [Hypothenemus hampei]|uniref:PiggyBac transposable element-derived protein domain-containing protein n=1 Tax=Hypothenemus hampei TaxID=57062 RepID=A0ABD1E2D0_HYPHA
MGVVRMLTFRDYWSTKSFFGNSVAKKIMTRARFEMILTFLHFADNQNLERNILEVLMKLDERCFSNSERKRKLIDRTDFKANDRSRCVSCYRELTQKDGRDKSSAKAKKVRTQCITNDLFA